MNETIKVSYLPLTSLTPYANNARTHSDAQIEQLARSITEYGWTNPILIDADGTIIAGHGRALAAKSLGIMEVPCIEINNLTPEQKRAYIIADNKLALNADWDLSILKSEMEFIGDINLDLLGFSDDEIKEILLEVDDIEEVDHFNETFNFSVTCKDLTELAMLQMKLGVSGKKIGAEKLIEALK